MTSCASRRRLIGFIPSRLTRYCLSIAKLPVLKTSSARPPVSSSSVAACWAMIVGSLRMMFVTSGPIRSREVRAAAAAKINHVLVVSLIGAVTRPEAKLFKELYDIENLLERLLRKKLVTEAHRTMIAQTDRPINGVNVSGNRTRAMFRRDHAGFQVRGRSRMRGLRSMYATA